MEKKLYTKSDLARDAGILLGNEHNISQKMENKPYTKSNLARDAGALLGNEHNSQKNREFNFNMAAQNFLGKQQQIKKTTRRKLRTIDYLKIEFGGVSNKVFVKQLYNNSQIRNQLVKRRNEQIKELKLQGMLANTKNNKNIAIKRGDIWHIKRFNYHIDALLKQIAQARANIDYTNRIINSAKIIWENRRKLMPNIDNETIANFALLHAENQHKLRFSNNNKRSTEYPNSNQESYSPLQERLYNAFYALVSKNTVYDLGKGVIGAAKKINGIYITSDATGRGFSTKTRPMVCTDLVVDLLTKAIGKKAGNLKTFRNRSAIQVAHSLSRNKNFFIKYVYPNSNNIKAGDVITLRNPERDTRLKRGGKFQAGHIGIALGNDQIAHILPSNPGAAPAIVSVAEFMTHGQPYMVNSLKA